jgi:hypothetical protein
VGVITTSSGLLLLLVVAIGAVAVDRLAATTKTTTTTTEKGRRYSSQVRFGCFHVFQKERARAVDKTLERNFNRDIGDFTHERSAR